MNHLNLSGLHVKKSSLSLFLTNRNSNVMYETGIAHTLGKMIILITQNLADIPSDTIHHRALKYLSNSEGRKSLEDGLKVRLKHIITKKKSLF